MRLRLRCVVLVLCCTACSYFAVAQSERMPDEPLRMPNGKNQQEEILKADHAQNLKDAAQLVQLSEQLKADLEKNDRHVLSIATLKKTDEIEKLVRKIRTRLRRN
jgi:hypothetical protein